MKARHPLHPAIVHFPIACWSLAVAGDVASYGFGLATLLWSAALLTIGCAMALLAAAAGLAELRRVPEGPALHDTWLHMGLMLAAFAFFAARLLLRLTQLQPLPPNGVSMLIDLCAFSLLTVGGWMGGRLVYGHGIGRA